MKKISNKIIPILTVLILALSCGKDDGSDPVASATEEPSVAEEIEQVVPDGSNVNGFYLAPFKTINGHIVGVIPGSASFQRSDGDRLLMYVRLFAGSPKAWHMQAVYTGNRCPELPQDDLNGDGVIDITEAYAVVGDILIPLDADTSTQASGRNFYPLGDPSGSYYYERTVSFQRFLNDLQSPDPTPTDNIAKLEPGKGLGFIGRVVMIQGISENVDLPETVATYGRHRPFQTLPIACGIFKKVTEVPGVTWDGTIPGPVAEVEDGQDRPAPTTPTPEGGSTGSTTTGSTGTNDSDDGQGPVSDGSGPTGSSSGGSSSTTGGSSSSTSSSTSSSSSSSTTGGASSSTSSSTTSSSTTGGTSTDDTSSTSSSSGTTTEGFFGF